ncbi:MAG: hypothetical protein V1859_04880 [archaeon]
MKIGKRGQAPGPASQAALLILVIGFAIIMYILMLPPEDRADLLGENKSYVSDGIHKENITVLVVKEPGTLDYLAKDTVDIDIPSFNLMTKTSAEVLVYFDSIYIRKSLFNYAYRNISFQLKDNENIDNFVLSFAAKKFKGILTIKLNGNIILSKELSNANPEPLQLPVDYLKKENLFEFEVSGPGTNFWESNEYILENVKITADITDLTGQENREEFLVSGQEKSLLLNGVLTFVIDCTENNVMPIHVYLNNKEVFSGIPDCGSKMILPKISGDRILEGTNTLRFKADKGVYLLYNVRIQLKLEKPIYPTYYFSIEEGDMFTNTQNKKGDLNITLTFSEGEEYKKGEIWLNGFITEIDTKEKVYTKKLNQYARKGNNAIEIRPKKDKLEVVELKVIYAE